MSSSGSGGPRPVTVLLAGHALASDNLGVGALTLAHMALLREAAAAEGLAPRFLVLVWPGDTRPAYGRAADVEPVTIRARHMARPGGPLGRALARADIVFDIGGGDSFTDIYGPRRFLVVWGPKARAILARRPLVLAPQTVGPFGRAWSRPLARWAVDRARLTATRDAPSSRALAALGHRGAALEATDVAMRLPHDPPPPRAPGGPVRVGLNVSGLLMSGGYSGANQFGLRADYPALVREIVARFRARPEVELHLVGHVQSESQPVEDDHRAGAALAAEFPGVRVSPVFADPVAAKSYIAGLDFFMAARMHAAIAAFSTGVPVIPMAYSRKFAGVFGTLGYDRVADCRAETAEAILARIEAGFAGRATLAAEIAAARAGVDARLDAYAGRAGRLMAEAGRA